MNYEKMAALRAAYVESVVGRMSDADCRDFVYEEMQEFARNMTLSELLENATLNAPEILQGE